MEAPPMGSDEPPQFDDPAAYDGEATYDGYGMAESALVGSHQGEEYASLPSDILNARPKPRLTDEEKLARDVMRRRQTDMERRARIFDAKRRMIGVDKETLDAQVAEKQAQEKQRNKDSHSNDRQMQQIDKELKLIELDKQRVRHAHERSCKDYSLQNLNFEARREYDLNDPLAKRKGVPARVGDSDPRCGPASMQKFSGEDLMKEERIRQQRAAMVATIEQQKFEKAMISRRVDDGGFGVAVAEVAALRNEIEEKEVALRKELQKSQYDDTIAQAIQNEERRHALARANMEDNARELDFVTTDKFINETGASHFNNRVIRDAYKGSSREERVQVAASQCEQRMEKDIVKAVEARDDRQFAGMVEHTRKQLVGMERDKQRRRREMREQNAADNREIQAQQAANLKYTSKLYKNEFSPEFFEQFGTGCR